MPKPAIRHSLLDDPLFGFEGADGRTGQTTLPGILARMSSGESTSLTAVQAHQQHAVHAFLVQLAALALHRGGCDDTIAHDEARWRELLVGAAKVDGADEDAFALVVSDLSKPAFMQPPVPEGRLDVLKEQHALPSAELDVVITSKNHDVKMERLTSPAPEHWAFALLTLQTMQGFLGRGNYGIARMNGGFASRPCCAFAASPAASDRFVRDTRIVLKNREDIASTGTCSMRGGIGLVWCAPWDGVDSLSLPNLDPFFVEICRRVRLTIGRDGAIVARRAASKAARISAKESYGRTGDPWTPLSTADGKALTMAETGFGYDRVRQLLFDDYNQGAAGTMLKSDHFWLGQVMVRGQGVTGGYHERWLPVPSRVRDQEGRNLLGQRAKDWVALAKTARLNILKPALLVLIQGAPEKIKFDDARVERHLKRLDTSIDADFFRLLFEHATSSTEAADSAFENWVFGLAKEELDAARDSLPVPSARRWKAETCAYSTLFGAARKHFPNLDVFKPKSSPLEDASKGSPQ